MHPIRLLICGLSIFISGEASGQQVQHRYRIPVAIQASKVEDACANGVVHGLNPYGDSFAAVRSGPGLRYTRLDKLYNGQLIYICVDAGDWWGIVYTKAGQDCNVSTPWPKSRHYTGPCRSGWAHKRWIQLTAG